jgi:hypothetical protein
VRQAFGQRGVNEFGATIGVAVGQTLDVTLQMRPAPTISGTITNATREPLAGAIVQAFRLHYIPFGRELRLTQTAMTDDHGEYRLFWLTPGDYYVAVTHSRTSERKLPAELPENPNLSKPDDVYSGIYYPGQTNWTDAKAIRVSAADVPGINMTWTEAGRVPVRGQITGGPPANAKITLLLEDGNPVPGFSQPVRSDATGAFTMRVTPGDYVLVAESEDGRHFSEVMPLIVPSRGIELLKVPLNLGLLMGGIALGANDLEGVLLKLCRTGPPTLGSKGCYGNYSYASHGKVLLQQFFLPFDDFEVFISLPSGFVLNTVPIVRRTALEPGPALSGTPMDPPTAAAENPDKVRPAKSLRNGSLSKADLLSMNQGEVPLVADLTGCEIAVGGVPNACLMFAVGGGGPGISGNVRNAIGDGISGAQVILVPEAPRGGIRPPNRYFRGASDATGRFEIPGVPAGVYTALAFEELEPGAYFASDFLERYGLRGVQVNPASIQNRGGRGGTNPDSVNLVIIPREDADR